jgi:integrase
MFCMSKQATFPMTIRSGPVVGKIYRSASKRTATGYLYQVAYHDGSVRRVQQFPQLAAAENFLRDTLAQLRAGRRNDAVLDGAARDLLTTAEQLAGDYTILDALRQWKAAVELTRDNLMEAARQWSRDNPSDVDAITLAEIVNRFLHDKQRQGIDVKAGYRNRLHLLVEAMPNMTIRDLTTPALNAYLNRFDNAVTRNTHRRNIVTMFTWARNQGYLPDAVRHAAQKTERASERDDKPVVLFSPAEYADVLRLIATDHPHYLAATVIAGFCGLRRAEVHNQVWADIDLSAGHLTVTKAKPRTPADRLVEIPPAALEWLLRCPNRHGNVCSNLAIDRVRDIVRTAGLACPQNGFRKSAISYRIAMGTSKGEVATWAGNSEQQINSHYRRPVPRALGEAYFALTPAVVLDGADNVIPMEAAQ